MARGKRTRLATGIYQDSYGIAVIVKVHGTPHEERHPLGTTLDTLRKARKDLKDKHSAGDPRARRGTLAEDFQSYLLAVPAGRRRRDEAALLQHWIDAGFGAKSRSAVTALDIDQQLASWTPRFAKGTRKHLRRVLGAVYRKVNGKSGENPVRDVSALTVRYEEPRGLPYWLIEEILEQLPDQGRPAKGRTRPEVNKTKLRLRVIAYTGIPQAQLGRVKARDVDWTKKRILVRPRRKGAGAEGRLLPLLPHAVDALRAFDEAGCWGPFSASSMAVSWRRAVDRARAGWAAASRAVKSRAPWPIPENVRAYDLRHSFGTVMYAQTGDLRAVGDALSHSTLEITKRYTLAAVDARVQDAFARVAAHLQDDHTNG